MSIASTPSLGADAACKGVAITIAERNFVLQKQEYSGDILKALNDLKKEGGLQKWGSVKSPERVNVFQGELKKVGVKNTGAIATPTIRNERAFLITTVGVTSVLAVAAGFLPGDWVSSDIFSPSLQCTLLRCFVSR